MLLHATMLLDIGRSVEYYRRHEHAAMILRSAGLNGFGHREILYLSLIMEAADHFDLTGVNFKPLLQKEDLGEIIRSAVLLFLADEIEHRVPVQRQPRLKCRITGSTVVVTEPALTAWDPRRVAGAFESSFGKKLRISSGN